MGAQCGIAVARCDLRISEAGAAVVHGDGYPCTYRRCKLMCLRSVDGVIPADGDHQHIHAAEPIKLFAREHVPDVAHVNKTKPLGVYRGDEVFPALLPLNIVVEAGQLAHGEARRAPREPDTRGVIVVAVAVAAYNGVRLQRGQSQPRHTAGRIRVKYDGAFRRLQLEAGVSIPCKFHSEYPLYDMDYSKAVPPRSSAVKII